MKKIKRLVYILAAQKDEKIAAMLAKKIDCERVAADILCGQNARERNASATNCDLCVVVISENTESDEDGRVESSVNVLTNKPTVRFIAQDEALSDSMEYYLAKTEAISEEDGDIRDRICAILDDLPYKKDLLIYAEQQEEDIAEQLSYDFLQKGISNILVSGYEDYCALLENCSTVIVVGHDKTSDFIKKALQQAKKRKKAALRFVGWDRKDTKVFSRVIQRTVSALYRIKPASKTMLVADTGKIKITHKPVFAIACAIICLQICAVFLWLLSVNREPLYSLPIIAALAGYIYVFLSSRGKCAVKGCNRNHNGKKCSVIVSQSGKYKRGRIIKLCDAHFDINDVSDYKNRNFIMPAATGIATAVFALFIIFSGAKAGDISFLSVIQAFQTLQAAKFEDPGFEAFVRQEFDIRDTTISRERLMDIKELHFNVDSTPEDINSLSDLRYFPSLRIFHVDDSQIMKVRGDIKNFKYTPYIEGVELGGGDFYGDIKVLSRLKKLKWFNKTYVKMEIYGDISAFSNLKEIESIHMPDCDISGNISELSDLRPYMLVLTMTNVFGDISSLSACESLIDLLIDSGDISGDLSSISNLSNLEHLELADNEITGKISDLMGMRLKGVDLSYTSVSGTLKDIASIKTLNEVIRFSNCINITGDVSDLAGLPSNINSICISQNPQFTGDLSSFAQFSQLEELELFQCSNLDGDLAEISELDRLRYIRLQENNFTGDIAAFKNMKDVYTLMVSETPVYGDIAQLSELSELEDVVLNNTGVYGDIAVFANMPKIHNIEVSGTGVYGDLSSLEGLEELYQVNTESSLVNGGEQRLHIAKDKETAFNMLLDTQVIFSETARQIGENMGQNLGEAKSAQLSEDAESYTITASKDGDYIIGSDFSKFGDFRNNNRAAKVKFRT